MKFETAIIMNNHPQNLYFKSSLNKIKNNVFDIVYLHLNNLLLPEFHEEMKDKLADLHYYDCLRTNKSMLASGVEVRVPFLDPDLLDIAMTIPVKMKHPNFIKVCLGTSFSSSYGAWTENFVLISVIPASSSKQATD